MPDETETLTSFKRDTARVLDRLKRTGNPVVLTVNGKAEVVVQDAAAYRQLLELAGQGPRAEMAAFLEESRDDIAAARTLPANDFLESLGRRS